MEFNLEFFDHLFLLLGLMVGFTTLKIACCKPFKKDGPKFSWKVLFTGTFRQLIVILGTCVVYFVGCNFGQDLFLVQIGDSKLTLHGAVDLTILAVLAFYAVKYIKNLAEFAGIDTFKSAVPVEYLCNDNTNTDCTGKFLGYVCLVDKNNCCHCNNTYYTQPNIQPVSIEDLISQMEGVGSDIEETIVCSEGVVEKG